MSMHQPVRIHDTGRWAPLSKAIRHKGKTYFVPEWIDVDPKDAEAVETAARVAAIWLWGVCKIHRGARR